jgi:hypothetical protein
MPAATIDKVIVTNLARLKAKYGAGALPKLRQAVAALIDADASRGLKTVLVDLSSAADMKRYKTAALKDSNASDTEANKKAVDGVHGATRPSYLMLLGAIDVIPHQDLKNPVFSADDTDEFAFGDLPYACEAPYSKDVRKFLAPARVVGRLPDVTGGKDPAYLAGLLKTAAGYQDRPASDYDPFLGISAAVWKDSTGESMRAVFGGDAGMKVVPPNGPPWSAADLKALAHFINCHGAPADWRFYGQKGNNYPPAHDASQLSGKLAEGTVLVAECCYGAELYDPRLTGGQIGMCNTYLACKAYGYFGSSTIAYGPASGNAQADLICQYFLRRVRAGASLGRACLEARLEYVRRAQPLSLTDLKTLAQFSLMADPALTPVRSAEPTSHYLATESKGRAAPAVAERANRLIRRSALANLGLSLAAHAFVAAEGALIKAGVTKKATLAGQTIARLLKAAADAGIQNPSIISAAMDSPPPTKAFRPSTAGRAIAPRAVHTVLRRMPLPEDREKIVDIRGLEAVEYDGSMEVFSFTSR